MIISSKVVWTTDYILVLTFIITTPQCLADLLYGLLKVYNLYRKSQSVSFHFLGSTNKDIGVNRSRNRGKYNNPFTVNIYIYIKLEDK